MAFGKKETGQEATDDRELMEQAELTALTHWVPPVVVAAVVLAFVTLAWYAYHAGAQSMKEDDLMVVEADKTPIKEKPADPGGMQFPNQDKTVFETFSGNMQQPPKVENVLPAPEEPLPKDADTSGTTTWINDKLHKADAPEQVIGAEEKPVAAPAVEAQPDVPVAPPAEEIAPKAAVVQHEEKKKTPPAPVAEAAHPKIADDNAGTVKVQLGAYRSEKEARDAWAKMLKKNAALGGHAPQIVKADLGAKGVYYRLRTGGFGSSNDAKAFCGKLTAGGQVCMLLADK